jgi:phosphatidate cytidylyltransferase
MRAELRYRIIFGITLAACVIGAITHDIMRSSHLGVLLLGLMSVLFGSREIVRLCKPHAPHVQGIALTIISGLLVLVAHYTPSMPDAHIPAHHLMPLILSLGFVWVVVSHMFRHATDHFITSVGATLLGILYLGLSMHMLQLLVLNHTADDYYRGTQLLLLFIAAVKLGDTAAYFGGRALGKHKMSPRISPGKSWEGFACSFIGAIGGSYIFCAGLVYFSDQSPFSGWWQPAVWGLILGPLGVLGDLAESAMKRDAAVKDSGASVPGFGGVLDILDAVILGAPVAYLLALILP